MPLRDRPVTPSPGRARRARRRAIVLLTAIVAVLAASRLPEAANRTFVWKVSGQQTAIYLMGSVHLLSKDYYPLSPPLDAAFKDSDLLVEEVDMGEMLEPELQLRILTLGMLPPGRSIESVLSPATFDLVSRKVAALGLPIEPLKQFKPWSLSLMLMNLVWANAGFDPNLGLDKHFYDMAKASGRLVQGLETTEFQISRFDEMTMPRQDRMLAETIMELETATASVENVLAAWRTGDVDTVERLLLQDLRKDPEMYQRLLVERNRNWLPKLEALFNRRGRALVIVGAAHLVGPDGLLQTLKSKGYTIEQL